LAEVERSLPTVVLAVSTSRGEEVVDVRIVVDGEELLDRIEGRAVAVDPGEHMFRVSTRQGMSIERRVVIRQGEKNRILKFRLPARDVPKPAEPPREAGARQGRTIPGSVYVLGVVSAVAVGGCAYFGLSGKSRQDDLESRCAPNCTEDETDAMYRRYLFSDISLGVALVSAGAATWIALSSDGEDKVPSLEAASYPMPGGGTLLLRQRF